MATKDVAPASAEPTTSAKLRALTAGVPATVRSADVPNIIALRDAIIILRALLGSGGTVTLTSGTKKKVGPSGLTQTFDDCLSAMIDNGMIDKGSVGTILKRDKAGKPSVITEVEESLEL